MREMVFNHASVAHSDLHAAVQHLNGISVAMAEIVDANVVERALRWHLAIQEITCIDGSTLVTALQEMRAMGARDQYVFFQSLTTKYPLLSDLNPDLRDRFNLCEATGCGAIELTDDEGKPLLLCAIGNGIAVSFPSLPIWDRGEFNVSFDELLDDDTFESRSEVVDNVSRPEHATTIRVQHQQEARRFASTSELWDKRLVAFPSLMFGPDVPTQLQNVGAADLSALVKKLTGIDEAAAEWQSTNLPTPNWRSKITRESPRVRNNRNLYDARRFRSCMGTVEIFEWHARYGSGNRIHFRFDAQTKDVEIGYIGRHLPL